MMCKVKHNNLGELIGACNEPLMLIVSELLPGMSLKNYLNIIRPSQLDIHTALGYALKIARAMECLHANGMIHRDLKPVAVPISCRHLIDFPSPNCSLNPPVDNYRQRPLPSAASHVPV